MLAKTPKKVPALLDRANTGSRPLPAVGSPAARTGTATAAPLTSTLRKVEDLDQRILRLEAEARELRRKTSQQGDTCEKLVGLVKNLVYHGFTITEECAQEAEVSAIRSRELAQHAIDITDEFAAAFPGTADMEMME